MTSDVAVAPMVLKGHQVKRPTSISAALRIYYAPTSTVRSPQSLEPALRGSELLALQRMPLKRAGRAHTCQRRFSLPFHLNHQARAMHERLEALQLRILLTKLVISPQVHTRRAPAWRCHWRGDVRVRAAPATEGRQASCAGFHQ